MTAVIPVKALNGYECGYPGCTRVLAKRFSIDKSEFLWFWHQYDGKWWCAQHWNFERRIPVPHWEVSDAQ